MLPGAVRAVQRAAFGKEQPAVVRERGRPVQVPGVEVFARAGNTIYLYGGLTGQEYPAFNEQVVEIETPFMSAQTPATVKMMTGFDMACENTWDVDVLVDPTDSTKLVNVGKITKTTYSGPHIHGPGRTSMVAVKMTCDRPGYATISNVAIHFEAEEAR